LDFAFSPFNVFDSGQTQPIQLRIYNGNQQIEEPRWFSYAYAAVAVKTSTLVVSALVRNIRPIANSSEAANVEKGVHSSVSSSQYTDGQCG
jgi:hypothetical protein